MVKSKRHPYSLFLILLLFLLLLLLYETPFCVVIYRSYELLNMLRFNGSPCIYP